MGAAASRATSPPAEVTGLRSAQVYAAGMTDAYAGIVTQTEQFAAGLSSQGVHGPAVAAVTRAQELTATAGAAWAEASAALDRQNVVKEAYMSAPEAGSKAFVTDTAGSSTPAVEARSAAAPASQWVKNPAGALDDELELASRIHLDPGERLVSSSHLQDDSGADVDLLFAVIHNPFGFHEVRIGVIPSDDVEKWTADAKGATAGLSADELRQARTDLAAAAAAADTAAGEADKVWDSGHAPTDPKQLGVEPVASGELLSANHDDLNWAIYVNDESSWDLSITPARGQFDGALLDPVCTGDLLDHLGKLQDQLDQAASPAEWPS